MASFTALYDACVLYPAPLRDLLMQMALTDLYRARWSHMIHDEWMRNLLRNRPDLTRERLERTRERMDANSRDCLVIGFEDLIDTLELPDPGDRPGARPSDPPAGQSHQCTIPDPGRHPPGDRVVRQPDQPEHTPRLPAAVRTARGEASLLTTRHPVDFPDTRAELEALFGYAHEHDVEKGGRYDARAARILFWSHHWLHPATREASEIIGSVYVRWGDTPALWDIETDEGFAIDDLMAARGRLELNTLDYVKHGDVPHGVSSADALNVTRIAAVRGFERSSNSERRAFRPHARGESVCVAWCLQAIEQLRSASFQTPMRARVKRW